MDVGKLLWISTPLTEDNTMFGKKSRHGLERFQVDNTVVKVALLGKTAIFVEFSL